jgi:quinol monooxygenase YgiN
LLQKIGIDPSTEISENWRDSKHIRQHCAYKVQSGFFEEAEKLIERIKEKESMGQPTKKIHRNDD